MGGLKSRIVVTGGCGFVGACMSRDLVRQGHDVTVIDDLSVGSQENLGPEAAHIDLCVVDIRDRAAIARCLKRKRPDAVVHLAAVHFIPACESDPQGTLETNVGGTLGLLHACRHISSIGAVVLASTAAVYRPSSTPHREGDPLGPTDIYGATKLRMEQLGAQFHRETGMPLAVARLFNVFGPGETNPHLIPTIVEQAQHGDILHVGNLSTSRDYVHVEDVARALRTLLDDGPRQGGITCNIGSEVAVDGQTLVRTIGRLLGRELSVRADPTRFRMSDRPHLCSDCSRARTVIRWSASTSLEEGLRSLLRETVEAGSLGTQGAG
jgi:UDP-glucose 4-epimerase